MPNRNGVDICLVRVWETRVGTRSGFPNSHSKERGPTGPVRSGLGAKGPEIHLHRPRGLVRTLESSGRGPLDPVSGPNVVEPGTLLRSPLTPDRRGRCPIRVLVRDTGVKGVRRARGLGRVVVVEDCGSSLPEGGCPVPVVGLDPGVVS